MIEKFKDYLKLFLIFNCINILIILLSNFFYVQRTYFVFEYNLIVIFFLFEFPFWISALYLCLLVSLDILFFTSSIFYFTWIDLLDASRFVYLHGSGLKFIIYYVIFIILILFLYKKATKSIINKVSKKILVFYLSCTVLFLSLMDIINGSNFLNQKAAIFKRNFTGSIAVACYRNYNYQTSSNEVPVKFYVSRDSTVTFKYFSANNESSKQLVIILESWGFLEDFNYGEMTNYLQKSLTPNYIITFNTTSFTGSTTYGEMRELLNSYGSYRYFIGNKSDIKGKISSIFNIKSYNKYNTIACHSYSGAMFYRKKWWRNIGIENSYFSEDIMFENRSKSILNTETSFNSVNDEVSYDFISKKSLGKNKVFAYLLTVNTHLPFRYEYNNGTFYDFKSINGKTSNDLFLNYSKNISQQQKRIFQQIAYFVSKINLDHWDEVLIVGDHPPPFPDIVDRKMFSQKVVPYLFVKKKK